MSSDYNQKGSCTAIDVRIQTLFGEMNSGMLKVLKFYDYITFLL